ncbi:uncharacterized protein LOC117338427 [Pecten maximus]|uniref:uncharacterized protein LOC117338427 n=1 Tax=Pecten maximus TaxID=6579 RepID=UPI0014590601|nr:uncharacterized protein LOC117338427 [Pecten maximus]
MDPGPLPPQLTGLTVVEQQLISRISPAINVYLLKHGGIAANGHCVTFPQQVNEPSQILPKLPSEINIIKVKKQDKNGSPKDYRVRRFTVQNALAWLKLNNVAYSDIIISNERLNNLPLDGDIALQDLDVSSVQHSNDKGPADNQTNPGQTDGISDSCVELPEPAVDIQSKVEEVLQEIIGPDHNPVSIKKNVVNIPWLTRGDKPLSEFTTKYFFTLAFPCLFLTASGDFYVNRPHTCESMSEWADHLLWYKDGRFAQHQYFKFIVHNIITRKRALQRSTYIVNQQLGDGHITVEELRDKLQNGDTSIPQKVLYFAATLRGTSQYWAQRSKELRALIQFQINEGKVMGPAFNVDAFWYRQEFAKSRGMIHWHGLCWRKDRQPHNLMFDALQRGLSDTQCASHLSNWAEAEFKMTASSRNR